MSWPTLIQLHNSEYSHSYDGSEIRETWYVEPWDAVTAFISSMLGRVDANADGVTPDRTLPASHFLYPWCFASACETVPYDPRCFSYMGSTNLQWPLPGLDQGHDGKYGDWNLQRIKTAVQTCTKDSYLFPTTNINYWPGYSQAHKTFSAGAFITVTYLPLLTLSAGTVSAIDSSAFNAINYRLIPRLRTNVINAGLVLKTPAMFANAWGLLDFHYPQAGIAPVMKEEYQELVVDRRMLLPSFNLSILSQYINSVNQMSETLAVGGVNTTLQVQAQTLRFDSFAASFVQVPSVDGQGVPNGYNRWLNLELHYDWRTTKSKIVRGLSGEYLPGARSVTWNHVLAYPGNLTWLNTVKDQHPAGLAWWVAKYSADTLGAKADPYPLVGDAVAGATRIFETLNLNW